MNDLELINSFTYHAPKEGQPALYEAIRSRALKLARFLNENVPESRELQLAVNALEETVMWANAAIARHE